MASRHSTPSPSRRPPAWLTGTLLSATASAIAYVMQVLVGSRLPSWMYWVLIVIGAACAFIAIYLPIRQQRLEEFAKVQAQVVAEQAAVTMRTEMQEYLTPLLNLLGDITSEKLAKARRDKAAQLKRAVVHTVRGVIKADGRHRACYFELVAGPPRQLRCDNIWAGRDKGPTSVFKAGEPAGDEMLRMVDARESRLNQDVSVNEPPGWPGNRAYTTYITTTVAAGGSVFGMLTVDAVQPCCLTTEDEASMRLLAQLLGAGLASAENSPRSSPQSPRKKTE